MTETTQTTETSAATPETSAPSFKEAASAAFDEMSSEHSEREEQDEAPQKTDTPAEAQSAKSGEADSPFSWDTIDARAKKEFEATQARLKGMQSYVTKEQQKWKANEEKLAKFSELESAQKNFELFSRLYESNSEVQKAIQKALGHRVEEVDPSLAQDPLFHYTQEREKQIQEAIRRQEEQMKPILEWYQNQQKQAEEAEINTQLDSIEKSASSKFTELMGREPTTEEMSKVLKHMVDKRVYDGEAATLAVFFSDFVGRQKQQAMEDQMKKRSVGSRVSQVNSKSGKSDKYSGMSVKDILREGLEEIGM